MATKKPGTTPQTFSLFFSTVQKIEELAVEMGFLWGGKPHKTRVVEYCVNDVWQRRLLGETADHEHRTFVKTCLAGINYKVDSTFRILSEKFGREETREESVKTSPIQVRSHKTENRQFQTYRREIDFLVEVYGELAVVWPLWNAWAKGVRRELDPLLEKEGVESIKTLLTTDSDTEKAWEWCVRFNLVSSSSKDINPLSKGLGLIEQKRVRKAMADVAKRVL